MSLPIENPQSLVEVLRWRAVNHPERVAYIYLRDGEDDEQHFTYGELDRRARAIAAYLQARLMVGDRALLLYSSGPEFVTSYLGCLYAGVIAVPTIIPKLNRYSARLFTILADSQSKIAFTTRQVVEGLRANPIPEAEEIAWVVEEDIDASLADSWVPVEIESDMLAFLQYTSGSTSAPKGVMISHANLLSTLQDLFVGAGHNTNSVIVTWLPTFHDLGLIYGLLTPLCYGFLCVQMQPVAFLEKPLRWLRAISKYGGTHVAAPNFAYDLCVRKVAEEEKVALDLSTLVNTANAAETVRLSTMENFARAFSACGFRFETFCPAYGLAEATVKVSNKSFGRPLAFCNLDEESLAKHKIVMVPADHADAYTIVGCGESHIGADIRIVHPDRWVLSAPDEIGEIWVRSPSVAQGYWNNSKATEETFGAYLVDTKEGPFLRTGDLGFIYDGELYITGRIKDMIIVQGRNFYPQDIELTVESCHPALQPSACAAFAVTEAGAERLVVVQEIKREFRRADDFMPIINAVRMAVAKNHGLRAHAVVLIRPASIFKTTSGKIQRGACREAFLRGELEVVSQWRAPIS